LLATGVTLFTVTIHESRADSLFERLRRKHAGEGPACAHIEGPFLEDVGGTWYWLRSPDEEKRVVAGLYNRYCIRCHGVDGRGVWDIPGVPDFTNPRWQASRSDAQRARIILEGRGAVMPPFRGAISLEEAWALGRYLHTFVPGTEVSRPDLGAKPPAEAKSPANMKPEPQPK
jgi:mono/diheme cytochrome c family protein